MKNIDLTKIFGSKTRTKLLEKFFLEYESGYNDGFHMRGLARDLDEQVNSIKRELDSLEEQKILKSKMDTSKKIFYLNERFDLINEFIGIFLKSYNPESYIKKYFKIQKDLDLALVSAGLLNKIDAKTTNIVDLFLIGEIDRLDFNEFLQKTFFNKKIKYAIITKGDFDKRIEFEDKLILSILKQKSNVFIIDKMGIEEMLNS